MTFALAPLSLLYGAAVRARAALYRWGALSAREVGAPVISVGNLTTGGTGKTPLVEWIARASAAEGKRVCVLSRGYGRRDESRRVVVSDGARVLAGFEEGGDEPLLLAERLVGAASVVCDADRAAAALWAREALGANLFVLDDGFQHFGMARDLEIVTVDATEPWGGGHLLPRGRLREPVRALARADCVVITRSDLAENLEALRAEVAGLSGGRALVLASRVRTAGLRPLDAAACDEELESLRVGVPVAAFCAVGNPRAFFEQLRREGFDLRHARAFKDHHAYTAADVAAVTRESVRRGARALLTTAKDAVKLRAQGFSLPCYVVDAGLEFEDEERLLALVRRVIEGGFKA